MPDLFDLKDARHKTARRHCPVAPARPRRHDYCDMLTMLISEPPSGRVSVVPSAVVSDLLGSIRRAADDDDAIDVIYGGVDALLRAGDFAQVDALLTAIDPSDWKVVHLLAFVSITSAARDHVAWAAFLDRVRQHVEGVEPERVRELLAGFE